MIHRIASLATAGLDVMPHNGAVITALAVVGLTHKQAYKPIFMLAVVTPMLTNVLAWSCPCNSGHADTVRLMTPHYA